jgi:predicted O-methyltransferase YrrM
MAMEMTPKRWAYTSDYLQRTFGRSDAHLETLRDEAAAAGLPSIAISGDVGRLLSLLASTTQRRLAIEVGTLGGYSGIWIARGLGTGRLLTIENEPKHADFAQVQFQKAGLAERVEIRRGSALEELGKMAQELAPGSVDFVFLDADKTEYPDYWRIVRPLIAKGGYLVADNILGSGSWWIDNETHPMRVAADKLSRTVAEDEEFEAVAVSNREGVLIARRKT